MDCNGDSNQKRLFKVGISYLQATRSNAELVRNKGRALRDRLSQENWIKVVAGAPGTHSDFPDVKILTEYDMMWAVSAIDGIKIWSLFCAFKRCDKDPRATSLWCNDHGELMSEYSPPKCTSTAESNKSIDNPCSEPSPSDEPSFISVGQTSSGLLSANRSSKKRPTLSALMYNEGIKTGLFESSSSKKSKI